MNTDLEQTRSGNITNCLDNQYHVLRKNVLAESEFLFGHGLPKRIMNVTANKKLFLTSKTSFQSYNPLLKVQKTCVGSLKTLGIATKMGTKSELVNTKNNTAAITATNTPNNRNIKIDRSSEVLR